MKNVILAVFTLLVLCFSCKKSSDPTPAPPPPTVTDPYMNLNADSKWNYELIDSNKSPVTVTPYSLTSAAGDSTIDGKSYHIFVNSAGNAHEYYNITDNDYFTFRELPALLGGAKVINLYLKDSSGIGTSWPQPYSNITIPSFPGATFTITTTNTIRGINLTKTVKGINYTDVIDVETTLAATAAIAPFPPSPIPADKLKTNIHSYYAPKYGLIQSDNYISLDYIVKDSVRTYTKLVSAVLK